MKVGSEVNYFILEVLPRMIAGAFVHFHDIYFPYDYPRTLMSDVVSPGESTLLHAFLIANEKYEIAAALSMLHYARPKELGELIPRYRPQRPPRRSRQDGASRTALVGGQLHCEHRAFAMAQNADLRRIDFVLALREFECRPHV